MCMVTNMYALTYFLLCTCMYTLGSGTGLGQPSPFSSGTGGTSTGIGGGGHVGVAAVGVEYALSQQLSEAIRVNLPSLGIYICIDVYNIPLIRILYI